MITFIFVSRLYEEHDEAPNHGLLEPTEVVDCELSGAVRVLHFLEVVAALQFLGILVAHDSVKSVEQAKANRRADSNVDNHSGVVESTLVSLLQRSEKRRDHDVDHVNQTVRQQLFGSVKKEQWERSFGFFEVVFD